MYRLHGAIHAYGGTTVSARDTADSVITALTPAAWYRNATDVVSSGGFASIWADYASSDKGFVLPGVAGNYASTPDIADYTLDGDVEFIVRVNALDWTPAAQGALISHYETGGNQRSFYILLAAAGTFQWRIDVDGTGTFEEAKNTNAPGLTDGETYWLKFTKVKATGALGFYKADDTGDSQTLPSSWTSVGFTSTFSAGLATFNSNAPLRVGCTTTTANMLNGVVFRTILKSGIDGTTVFDADFSSQAIGTASFTESSSNAATVTISTSGAAPAHIGKARDLLQGTGTNQPAYAAGVFTADGADNYMRASFTLNNGCTIILVGSQVSWTGNDYLVGAVSANVALFQLSATPKIAIYAGVGNIPATGTTNLALGTRGIIVAVYNGASSSLRVNNNAKDSGNAGASNLGGVTLFASHVPGGYANATAEEMVVFSSALSDANVDSVVTALNNALTVF